MRIKIKRSHLSLASCFLAAASVALAAGPRVDPTFLRRHVPDLPSVKSAISTASCHYKAVFGEGDKDRAIAKGVTRYGEVTVDPSGSCQAAAYAREEQVYVALDGAGFVHYGEEKLPFRKNDFIYLPPGVKHGLSAASGAPLRAVIMGFRIPADMQTALPPRPLMANIDEVKKQVVGNHPPSTLYQLLIGDTRSTRDRIAAAHVLTSLFIMEIAPGGTNTPHHHEREEEIYLLLDGTGEMVAGGGMDGVEGRHPARPGDAFFFRLNCTVGFYSSAAPDAPKARILAVRSLFPFPRR